MLVHFDIAGSSDKGRVRTSNQDCIHVDARLGFFVLADGVGGGPAGATASRVAVDAVREVITPPLKHRWHRLWGRSDEAWLETMRDAVSGAHAKVLESAADSPSLAGMATTLLVGLLAPGRCLSAAVGDSRLYHVDGAGIHQVTEDQTLAVRMMREGFIGTADPAFARYMHVLVEAVGGETSPEVQQHVVSMAPGERVLACSDGLSNMLDDDKIRCLTAGQGPLRERTEKMVAAANEAGGKDNISVIIAASDERRWLPLCG